VVTRDVPADALYIERGTVSAKPNFVRRYLDALRARKAARMPQSGAIHPGKPGKE
jgi:hypothetical protein